MRSMDASIWAKGREKSQIVAATVIKSLLTQKKKMEKSRLQLQKSQSQNTLLV